MRLTVIASLSASVLVGCAVPADSHPHQLDDNDVPFGLLDPSAPPVVSVAGGRAVTICLLQDGNLVPVTRRLAERADLQTIAQALGALSDSEAAQGLQTAVSGPDEISSVTLTSGTALVDFAKEAEQTLTADPLATAAQLTCTLTAQPGVGLVRFSVDGTAIEVPTADGALTDSPVSRDDYADLYAPASG